MHITPKYTKAINLFADKIFLVAVSYAAKKKTLSSILSIDQAKLSDVIKYTYKLIAAVSHHATLSS